jgi:hypothetical protein
MNIKLIKSSFFIWLHQWLFKTALSKTDEPNATATNHNSIANLTPPFGSTDSKNPQNLSTIQGIF